MNSTSSALKSRVGLNHGVLWNFTPSRSLNVKLFASGEISQLMASLGCNSVVGRLKPSRLSNICALTVLVLALSHMPGSKPSGLASAQ